MKREDLKALSLTDEQIDKIMAENGKDIEAEKAKVTTAKTEIDGLKRQLTEAGTTIEGFKALKPDELKAAADEWKVKAETAQTEATKQISQIKFDHALEGALSGAKARNPKAVKALLDMANLKLNEADGSVVGLEDQLKKVKEANDYLFEDTVPIPKIILGGNNQSVIGDKFLAAALRGAGLPESK